MRRFAFEKRFVRLRKEFENREVQQWSPAEKSKEEVELKSRTKESNWKVELKSRTDRSSNARKAILFKEGMEIVFQEATSLITPLRWNQHINSRLLLRTFSEPFFNWADPFERMLSSSLSTSLNRVFHTIQWMARHHAGSDSVTQMSARCDLLNPLKAP